MTHAFATMSRVNFANQSASTQINLHELLVVIKIFADPPRLISLIFNVLIYVP